MGSQVPRAAHFPGLVVGVTPKVSKAYLVLQPMPNTSLVNLASSQCWGKNKKKSLKHETTKQIQVGALCEPLTTQNGIGVVGVEGVALGLQPARLEKHAVEMLQLTQSHAPQAVRNRGDHSWLGGTRRMQVGEIAQNHSAGKWFSLPTLVAITPPSKT